MASILQVTTELSGSNILITAEVLEGGTLPRDIFIYENTGTETLGSYYGVCTITELGRLLVFSNSPIPKFGNKFVRYNSAKIKVGLDYNYEEIIAVLKKNVENLSRSLQIQTTKTSTYVIQ